MRISRAGSPPPTRNLPLVVFSNHASWWDPLVCLVLKREFFPHHRAFAPMDAAMLERYRLFKRLGFFPVEQHTSRGARQFLRTAAAVLRSPGHLLALTPQGRFADVRERPLQFQAGLGHLARRVERALFVPLAVEYVFWEERLPESLVRFGEPLEVRRAEARRFSAQRWTSLFQHQLEAAQEALSSEAQERNRNDFALLLKGGAGPGGVYDAWRHLLAALRGQQFSREHGRL